MLVLHVVQDRASLFGRLTRPNWASYTKAVLKPTKEDPMRIRSRALRTGFVPLRNGPGLQGPFDGEALDLEGPRYQGFDSLGAKGLVRCRPAKPSSDRA